MAGIIEYNGILVGQGSTEPGGYDISTDFIPETFYLPSMFYTDLTFEYLKADAEYMRYIENGWYSYGTVSSYNKCNRITDEQDSDGFYLGVVMTAADFTFNNEVVAYNPYYFLTYSLVKCDINGFIYNIESFNHTTGKMILQSSNIIGNTDASYITVYENKLNYFFLFTVNNSNNIQICNSAAIGDVNDRRYVPKHAFDNGNPLLTVYDPNGKVMNEYKLRYLSSGYGISGNTLNKIPDFSQEGGGTGTYDTSSDDIDLP